MKKSLLSLLFVVASVANAQDAAPQMKPADCSMMSVEEQTFAKSLNAMNKSMFCGKMSADQRKTAMDMSKQPGMTPDGAMDKTMMAPGQKSGATSGCPVK